MKDRIKLSFADRSLWYWNHDGNKTYCRIPCRVNIGYISENFVSKLQKLFPKIEGYTSLTGTLYFNVRGKAKLHPDDKYKKSLGMHIAESRAKAKAYSVANRIACVLCDMLSEQLDQVQAFTVESCDQYEHELDHVDYLIENG